MTRYVNPSVIRDRTAERRDRKLRRCPCGAWIYVERLADDTPPCRHLTERNQGES